MIELDSLHVGDLKIYRDTETFAYGTDSVVLAYFAGMKKATSVCDLCSGSGIVPLLMSAESRADFTCVEIDEKPRHSVKKALN